MVSAILLDILTGFLTVMAAIAVCTVVISVFKNFTEFVVSIGLLMVCGFIGWVITRLFGLQ